MRNPLLNWLFYGHLWIALAATGLSWQSTFLSSGDAGLYPVHAFVFFATLGVYTLHRLLSYHRADGQPDGRRYRVVSLHPGTSLMVGAAGIMAAVGLAFTLPLRAFWPVLLALPFTFFYLIPLFPGGPRLRDLPYLKVVWVALAWTCMTDLTPALAISAAPPEPVLRFCFTLAVALLFDLRDVDLDRRQGVRTLAGTRPALNRSVALGLLLVCAAVSFVRYPPATGFGLALAYALAITIGWKTTPLRGEDYYATAVNGMLLLPPLGLLLLG
ncbi:4-hydroxybenzoate polyprenyltransferase [Lewinella marina]|uniref:Prenyltransferase n=1 Tax=Neolewinella marina TaxID=438751 RepID=A0A2G0CJQ5_9BACT|nr:hypothetical protein [Neolewinella marina]NJB84613.1 4-hydroxybenzoate polyprenyltransferase [Neolewinella marina]PHL00210.1 hypothetical protein CGL56_04000 [Neolewinella marina]